ncbi:MAG TPA: hypothetical protein VMT11_14260 [Myxococcaceae bacterium]|nr:hypothetical protein [Myxococcaceae bacterium]
MTPWWRSPALASFCRSAPPTCRARVRFARVGALPRSMAARRSRAEPSWRVDGSGWFPTLADAGCPQ